MISIIALLLSILTPALNTVRESARRVVCKTRVKGMLTGIFMYASDWNDCMPTWDHWWRTDLGWHIAAQDQLAYAGLKMGLGKLYPGYLKDGKLYFCPSQRNLTFENASYEWNTSGFFDEYDFYYGMDPPFNVSVSVDSTYHLRGDLKIDGGPDEYEKILLNHSRWMIMTDAAIFWNAILSLPPGDPFSVEAKVARLVNHRNRKGQPAYYSCGWADGSVTGYKVKNANYFMGQSWPYNTIIQEQAATVMDVMARNEW